MSAARRYLLPLLLLLSLAACQRQSTPLIRIADRQINLDQFRRQIHPLRAELVQLPAEQQKLLLRQALSQLIDQDLLLAEARRRGIAIDEQEMQKALDDLRGDYSEAEYREILRASGQNPEDWLQQLRLRLLSEKVAKTVTSGKIHIDDKQIEAYYLQHLEDYRRPEQLKARQMLLNSMDEANDLRNRVLAGEAFAALATRYSLSPDHENGGDLGLFARGQLPPEFDAVLFDLPPGRVSEPVKSPYGIHLFLVEKRFAAGVLPLEEVSANVRRQLQTTEETRLYQQWLHELRDATPVRIDWEQLDKLHFDKAQ